MVPEISSKPLADVTGHDAATAFAHAHWETFKRKHLLKPVIRHRASTFAEAQPVNDALPDGAPDSALPNEPMRPAAAAGAATEVLPDSAAVTAEPRVERRTGTSVAIALLSAAVGAYLLWHKGAMFGGPEVSLYAAAVFALALLGARPLMGRQAAHASLAALSPLAWAAVTLAWPAVTAALLLAAIDDTTGRVWMALLVALALLAAGAAVWTMSRVGTLLTMRAPWPSPVGAGFRGWASPLAWLGLIATFALDYWLLAAPHPLAELRMPSFARPAQEMAPLPETDNPPARADDRPARRERADSARTAATAERDATAAAQAAAAIEAPAAPAARAATETPAAPPDAQEAKSNETARAVGAPVAELLAQARELDKAGRVEAAIAKLEKAWQLDPANADVALALARGQRISRKFELENRTLRKLLEQQPRHSAALLALGDNHLRLRGSGAEAIEEAAGFYVASHRAASDPDVTLDSLRRRAAEIGQEFARARAAQRALDLIDAAE